MREAQSSVGAARAGLGSLGPDRLALVALGGLGQIGMNCLALAQGDDIVLVDCGVTFPTQALGIDVLIPRFDFLADYRERVRGLVVTHGHEDHIGAIPYLLDEIDVPIWAPAHAAALIKSRLDDHRFDLDAVDLRTISVGRRFEVGSFAVEALRVTHSIADATALAIDTAAGVVVHTGDFKLDETPVDGQRTDEARLAALGDAGVRLLLSDSTGIDVPGVTRSETAVADALEEHIAAASGRVIVGMFASNVQRLIALGRIAKRVRRRVCLLGRSVITHARVGRDLGMLEWASDLVVSPEIAAELPPRDVLVLATGTQAEERAALTRLARDAHPKLKLLPTDTIILSSRIIPGNDRPVVDLMGALLRKGVRVISRFEDPRIHASGHACRGELERMIELTRPRAFMPVHGTRHHLTRHAELATDLGVPEVIVAEDGEVVEIGRSAAPRQVAQVVTGRVAIFDREPLDDLVIRDRARIAERGVLAVSVTLARGWKLAATPCVEGLGVFDAMGHGRADAERDVERALAQALRDGCVGDDAIIEVVSSAARRSVDKSLGLKPEVMVLIQHTSDDGAT